MALNAIPEKVKAGIKLVDMANWPTESANERDAIAALLPVDPSFDLHPETSRTPDEAVRGILARTYNSYEGMKKVVGSLSGPCYPNLFGAILKAICGSSSDNVTAYDADGDVSNDTWEHRMVFQETPQPFTVSVEHTLPAAADQVRAYGCIPSSLSLSANAAEGVATYTLDFEGVSFSDSATQTISAKQVGEGGTEFYCPVKPFKGFWAKAEVGSLVAGTDFRLISMEISIERELTLFTRFQSDQLPNSYAWRAPKITLSLVTEFLTYTAYKYAQDFEDYKGAVILQLCSNSTSIAGVEASTDFSELLASGPALDTNRGVLYLRFPNVDFGEGPVKIDHAAAPLTLEWNCEALPDTSGRLMLNRAGSSEGLILVNGTAAYNVVTAGADIGWKLS